MSSEINHLQQLINNIQQQMGLVSTMTGNLTGHPPATMPAVIQPNQFSAQSQADIGAYVKQLVAAEIAAIRPTQPVDITPQPQQIPQAPAPQHIQSVPQPQAEALPMPTEIAPPEGTFWDTLSPVMGAAYTKEQQLWLSQTSNLVGLPGFLMTAEGKNCLTGMLENYQKFMGVK